MEKEENIPNPWDMIYRYEELLQFWDLYPQILLSTLPQSMKSFDIQYSTHVKIQSIQPFHQKMDVLEKDLQQWIKNKVRIVILVSTRNRGRQLESELKDRNLPAVFHSKWDHSFSDQQITITLGGLHKGFNYIDIGFVIVSEKDVFGERRKKKRARFKDKGRKIQSFTDLKVGDYIVHENHGIEYKVLEQCKWTI